MCWHRPYNRPVIPAEYRIPSSARCRCSIVCRYKFPAAECISQRTHCTYESLIILSSSLSNRISRLIQRPPLLYFFYIFHYDNVWKDTLCVLIYSPREDSQPFFPWLSPFRLAVAGTVWACPHQRHMTAGYVFLQVNLKDILCQMQCVRMIYRVHPDCLRIMVYRNINLPSQCHFNSNTCPASSCKAINNQISHFSERSRDIPLRCAPLRPPFLFNLPHYPV